MAHFLLIMVAVFQDDLSADDAIKLAVQSLMEVAISKCVVCECPPVAFQTEQDPRLTA